MHQAQAAILPFFRYEHLPPALQAVSAPFAELAREVAAQFEDSPHGAEVTTCLRKLLEAKDCAVRAALGAVDG